MDYSKQYFDIHQEVHSRPHLRCSSKAIVRNLSIWVEDSRYSASNRTKRPKFDSAPPSELSAIIDQEYGIERELLNITFNEVCTSYAKPLIKVASKNNIFKKNKYRLYTGYDFNGYYNRILVSRHYNRVSVIHVVDFLHKSSSVDAPPQGFGLWPPYIGKRIPDLRSALSRCERLVEKYKNIVESDDIYKIALEKSFEAAQDQIRERFWESKELTEDPALNGDRIEIISNEIGNLLDRHWAFVDSFTDFQRLNERIHQMHPQIEVFGDETGEDEQMLNLPKHIVLKTFFDSRGLVWPGFEALRANREGIGATRQSLKALENGKPSDKEILVGNWCLIKGLEYRGLPGHNAAVDGIPYAATRPITSLRSAQTILAGSISSKGKEQNSATGIFVSTLGRNAETQVGTPDDDDRYYGSPTRYFVFAKTSDDRLLGRMLQSIDTLEVFRHITLRDLPKVREAGKEIQKILELSERVDYNEKTNSKLSTSERLEKVVKERKGEVGKNIEGGLLYRTSNSIYYYDNLKQFMSTLEFHQIPGHDTYETFIKRTLFKKLDYVSLTLSRLEKLNGLFDQTIEQARLSAVHRESEQRNRLTEFAHFIEIFAVTYYFGSVLSYILPLDLLSKNAESSLIFSVLFLAWWKLRDFPGKAKKIFEWSERKVEIVDSAVIVVGLSAGLYGFLLVMAEIGIRFDV